MYCIVKDGQIWKDGRSWPRNLAKIALGRLREMYPQAELYLKEVR